MIKLAHKFFICTLLLTMLTSCGGNQNQNNDKQDSIMNTELKPFDVQKDFTDNGFTYFTKNLILCVGDSTESNAMTIGWGGIGNYLGHERA